MPIELVANHQLIILTSKKLIPDTMYAKLQSKNIEHQQQRQDVLTMGGNSPLLLFLRKSKNMLLPVNADGVMTDVQSISINIGA